MIVGAFELSKQWDGHTLFDNVTMELEEGERAALIGPNGAGKTTLVKALLGEVPIDSGTIQRAVPTSEWGWMEQDPQVDRTASVIDYVRSGSVETDRLRRQISESEAAMTAETDPMLLDQRIAEYSDAIERYEAIGGYSWEIVTEKTMQRLGLERSLWTKPFAELSGGQKTRAQLARIVVKKPKFLLLDEPTNHLDQETMEWLESWLHEYSGGALIISHDRAFLDSTVSVIYELSPTGTKRYKGGYSDYKAQKEIEMRSQEALYRKQQHEKEALLEAMRRYAEWYDKAHRDAGERNPFMKRRAMKNSTRFKAKEKSLERLEQHRVDAPRTREQLHVRFADKGLPARTLLRLEQVQFGYGSRPVLSEVELTIGNRDRIAVLGANGTGKTTLMKLLIGELDPTDGVIIRHPRLRIGYFSQELDDLDSDESILDSLLVLPGMTESHARTILACFLFRKDQVFKRIRSLSMGEKCRVAFIRLYFSEAHLLVLDEPTNYLDIDTRERMEVALEHYPGAVVAVTHDRYLARRIAVRIAWVEGGKVRMFEGGYDQFADRRHGTGMPSPVSGSADGELRQLQLRLAQLISAEEPDDPVEQQQLLETIRDIQRSIRELQSR